MTVRNRGRTIEKTSLPNVQTCTETVGGSLTEQWNGDPNTPLPVRVEGMLDITGNRDGFNPVSHLILNQVPGTPATFQSHPLFGPTTVITWGGQYLASSLAPQQVALPLALANLDSAEGFLPSGEASQFTREALDKVLKQVPEEVSIANFLWELREWRSLIPSLQGWLTVPNQFLNWNFGWLPMIQDIKKLLTLVSEVNKRLDHLKKVNGRTVTISHMKKFVLVNDSSPYSGEATIPPDCGPPGNYTKVSYQDVEARIHISVSYDLDLSGADVFTKAMCAALGLNNPAKIIWNAIPFSFVADWITHLGDFLDSASYVQPFKGKIAIRGSSCSFKVRTFIDSWNPIGVDAFGNVTWGQYANSLARGYHRRSGTPVGSFSLTGLTPFQQSLAAALLVSNAVPRLPRRRRH